MRKIFTIIIYTIIVLLIGRSLAFLPKIQFLSNPKKESLRAETQIKRIVSASKGNYAVYFIDLKNENLSFGINENAQYTAFSLNKVPIVAVLYNKAFQKEIKLEEQITLQEDDIQDYGTGSLRYEEPGSVYSLKTLANLALNKSDNTAAHILANKIGLENIQKQIENWDLKQTDMENDKTSLSDMYLLFKTIYKGEIAGPLLAKELLGFMKNTDIEDRLPKNLPKEVNVYHKTADGVGSIYDIGIIEGKDFVYFLGVLTADTGDQEEETKAAISEISKKVFEFEIAERN